jgi:hypothetical protein
MRATFFNCSQLPRRRWTSREFTIPKALSPGQAVEMTFVADDGRRFRAVTGDSCGLSTVVRVRLTMGGYETISGELVDEPHPDAGPFELHQWVRDDPTELVPGSIRYRVPGGSGPVILTPLVAPHQIEDSPAHQLFHMRSMSHEGVVFEWWTELNHDDPVAQVWGKLVWSDRVDPAHTKAFRHLVISCGEQIALDFRVRHNNPEPNQERHRWGHMVGRLLSLDDATGLPMSGAMLCFASPQSVDLPKEGHQAEFHAIQVGLRDLRAGAHGPIVGVSHDWDGHWGACGNTPKLGSTWLGSFSTDRAWNDHLSMLQTRATYFVTRPIGAATTPSQTGSQEDHGAVKGTDAVSLFDPRWIRRAQYSMQAEILRRGYHFHEADGSPLRVEDHPGWDSYNGLTWLNTSSDRLGKEGHPPFSPATEWGGYDEEHLSVNNLAAYLTLSHSPLLQNHVEHMVTMFESDYRVRYPNYGIGAARAQGRTLGALAQLWKVAPIHVAARIRALITKRLAPIAANPSLHVAGPMKVLEWRGPDGRKPIFTDPSRTELAPWVSMWEHGLAAVGLKQCADGTGMGHDVLLTICETLAEFGCLELSNGWWTVDDILWNNGDPPPGWPYVPEHYISWHHGVQGTGNWTRAGLLVAREVIGDTHPLAGKLDAYIQATGGYVTNDKTMQEWAAAVKVR